MEDTTEVHSGVNGTVTVVPAADDFSSEPGPSVRMSSVVTPGVKDSDGFLTPPPASTLLIRRTRTNSAGSSTYVVASNNEQQPSTSSCATSLDSLSSTLPLEIRKSFSVPYRRLHKRSSSTHRRTEPYKRLSFTKKVNVVVNPQKGTHVQVNLDNNGHGGHRSNFPPISPLALDPSHTLSVTLSSDRSISTVVPIESLSVSSNPFVFPTPINGTATEVGEKSFKGIPSSFMTTETQVLAQTSTGKGMPSASRSRSSFSAGKQVKRKRGERGPDRVPNIDPSTGKRRYVRKKRFTLDRRTSFSGRRMQGRSHHAEPWRMNYDHELTGKWRPTDDLRLIINTEQIKDLELVHRGVRFSCKFTLENIERRWGGLLYDKAISKVSINSIQNLHPKVIANIYENALFSAEEDKILKGVRSTHDPKQVKPLMEKLLKDHALVFLKWRSPRILIEHWLHLREYHLLCDQNVQDYFDQESFSDFEDSLSEREIREYNELDINVKREIQIENRHTKKMLRILEEEVSRWQLLADMVTEIEQPPFEEGSFAILRGKQVRYLMRSREITLGRRTPTSLNVDADLSMEGSTYKVSRRQATIQLRTLGDFVILNQGKHAIYIDGNVVMPRKLGLLVDQSVIEIAQLRFVFLINHKLVDEQRKRWVRIEVKKEMMRLSKIARFIKAHPAYPVLHPAHPLNPAGAGGADVGVGLGTATSTKSIPSTVDVTPPEPVPSTSKFTGSLTRPLQPPKYAASSTSSTTFIRSFVPPAPSPRIISTPPLFRKPLMPPPPVPTIITQPTPASKKHVSIHSLRTIGSPTSIPVPVITTNVTATAVVNPPLNPPASYQMPPPSYSSLFPVCQRTPLASTQQMQGIPSDLTIRPGLPPPPLNKTAP